MALVLCTKCGSVDGVLCKGCGKPNHFDRTKRGWSGDRLNGCWRQLRYSRERFKTCEGHEAPISECDACHLRAPSLSPHRGWWAPRHPDDWKNVRTIAGTGDLLLCPGCQHTFAVGLDMAMAASGAPLLSESVACAFAFQLGQVLNANRAEHRHVVVLDIGYLNEALSPTWNGFYDIPF